VNSIIDLKSGKETAPGPLPRISAKRQGRIKQVQDMWMSGAKTGEIALYFNISQRTVQKDLVDAKRLARLSVQDFDSKATLGHELAFLRELRRQAMRNFHLSQLESPRVGFLRLAAEVSGKLTNLLLSTGLITKAPEQVMIEENPFFDVDFRKKYVALLKEARERGVPIAGL
jgi:hypothetical protein